MSATAAQTLSVVDLLAEARAGLVRLDPLEARIASQAGATLVDIRPVQQRLTEGEVPDAVHVERNVLEWRFDPTSEARLPEASYDLHVIVLCSEGYTSSLAAHALQQLGVRRATDVIGGVQAWKSAGLPTVTPQRERTLAAVPEHAGPVDLEVNLDHRSARVAGLDIELTRMEFDLLAHLVNNPHRVHTRRQLLQTLWSTSWDAGSRTVDVHVHRLRAKLGAPWSDALVTVRGVGYRWVP